MLTVSVHARPEHIREEEVAQAVGDGHAAERFHGLEYVRMVADDRVRAGLGQLPGEVPLLD